MNATKESRKFGAEAQTSAIYREPSDRIYPLVSMRLLHSDQRREIGVFDLFIAVRHLVNAWLAGLYRIKQRCDCKAFAIHAPAKHDPRVLIRAFYRPEYLLAADHGVDMINERKPHQKRAADKIVREILIPIALRIQVLEFRHPWMMRRSFNVRKWGI